MSATAVLAALLLACTPSAQPDPPAPGGDPVALPSPSPAPMPLEAAIEQRRSVRSFRDEALPIADIARILRATQGITGDGPQLRAVPSAGARHPLELYVVVEKVEGLERGVYHYDAVSAQLEQVVQADITDALAAAALDQRVVATAPACLVITADYARTRERYGERGDRYVHMEVGHAAQNVYLVAEALGLGTVSVGAFEDDELEALLQTPWAPLLIMPIGRPRAP